MVEYPNLISVQMDYRYPGDLNPCVSNAVFDDFNQRFNLGARFDRNN